MIKFVNNLRHVRAFLCLLRFHSPTKLTAPRYSSLKYCLKWRKTPYTLNHLINIKYVEFPLFTYKCECNYNGIIFGLMVAYCFFRSRSQQPRQLYYSHPILRCMKLDFTTQTSVYTNQCYAGKALTDRTIVKQAQEEFEDTKGR